jgi:hypothetical protein
VKSVKGYLLLRCYQARNKSVIRLSILGKNHTPKSILAQRIILLAQLFAVDNLVHSLRSRAVRQPLSDQPHPLDCDLVLAHQLLIADIKVDRVAAVLEASHGLPLLSHFCRERDDENRAQSAALKHVAPPKAR